RRSNMRTTTISQPRSPRSHPTSEISTEPGTVQVAKRTRRGRSGGRPPAFDREAYKRRNTVERCISKLKQWRGLATRYDKTATSYLAGLHIVAISIWSAR
ncbi:hypothetical protein ACI2LW_33415, partial [Streptomyces sp. NPDC004065]